MTPPPPAASPMFLAVGILALATGVLALILLLGDPGRRRLALRARRLRPGAQAKLPMPGGPSLRRESQAGLDGFIHRLTPRPALLRARLAATGTGLSIGRYGLICIVVAVGVPLVLILRGLPPAPAILLGLLGGLALPHMVVGWLVKRRRTRFLRQFPEGIGLMVRGLKAGLPVTETMIVVGREVAGPVGEEFRRVSDQIRLGQSIEDALWQAAGRLDLPEFNFLVITFAVQRETGGNLAETLENLDDVLRMRHQMKQKVKAMSSEAVASAIIIGCLPFAMGGMIFLTSPSYIMVLFKSTLGLILVGAGATSLLIGVLVMAKMVSFDI